jgi:hypothetical protein
MTKLRLLALLALVLTVFACKKEEKTDDPNSGSTARFKITGVKDVDLSLSSTGTATLPVSVVTNTGAIADTVAVQVTGLPAGIRAAISPASGVTSFASEIRFINEFNGPGGTFPISILGIGKSGTMTYKLNLTVPGYLGWIFNDTAYTRSNVVKDAGRVSGYAYIYADAQDGSRLVINFPYKAEIPTRAATYKIGAAAEEGTLRLQLLRDSTQVFTSTGTGNPSASFSFDTAGRFIFKCSDVQMTNGVRTGKLSVSLPELVNGK